MFFGVAFAFLWFCSFSLVLAHFCIFFQNAHFCAFFTYFSSRLGKCIPPLCFMMVAHRRVGRCTFLRPQASSRAPLGCFFFCWGSVNGGCYRRGGEDTTALPPPKEPAPPLTAAERRRRRRQQAPGPRADSPVLSIHSSPPVSPLRFAPGAASAEGGGAIPRVGGGHMSGLSQPDPPEAPPGAQPAGGDAGLGHPAG